MTNKVVSFPAQPMAYRNKAELADVLVELSELVRSGAMEFEPEAFAIVFTSRTHHEFVAKGHAFGWDSLIDATRAHYKYALAKEATANTSPRKTN